ncbi:MAG: hypothetical protein HQ546_04860 [Planctomycetes bacterium]|nr:hypothetical protein [Planctomycetota bacterium]
MKIMTIVGLTVALLVTSASAGLYVEYKAINTTLNITGGTTPGLTIVDNNNPFADLMVWFKDGGTTLDATRISGGGDFNLLFSVALTDLPGTDNWSANGMLSIMDADLDGDVVVAAFQSTKIWITDNALRMDGRLQALGGGEQDSILKPDSEPWIFVGEGPYSLNDADGLPNQVTVSHQDWYGYGGLFSTQFGVSTSNLDELFKTSATLEGGEVHGSIVPIPGAVILGSMGLGLVGWRFRKRMS